MKKLFVLFSIVLVSCQKRLELLPEIGVTITAVSHQTVVNGIYGDYWKTTISIDKSINKDVLVKYYIKDLVKNDLSVTISKGTQTNIFTTQIPVLSAITAKGLIEVTGADNYLFVLK